MNKAKSFGKLGIFEGVQEVWFCTMSQGTRSKLGGVSLNSATKSQLMSISSINDRDAEKIMALRGPSGELSLASVVAGTNLTEDRIVSLAKKNVLMANFTDFDLESEVLEPSATQHLSTAVAQLSEEVKNIMGRVGKMETVQSAMEKHVGEIEQRTSSSANIISEIEKKQTSFLESLQKEMQESSKQLKAAREELTKQASQFNAQGQTQVTNQGQASNDQGQTQVTNQGQASKVTSQEKGGQAADTAPMSQFDSLLQGDGTRCSSTPWKEDLLPRLGGLPHGFFGGASQYVPWEADQFGLGGLRQFQQMGRRELPTMDFIPKMLGVDQQADDSVEESSLEDLEQTSVKKKGQDPWMLQTEIRHQRVDREQELARDHQDHTSVPNKGRGPRLPHAEIRRRKSQREDRESQRDQQGSAAGTHSRYCMDSGSRNSGTRQQDSGSKDSSSRQKKTHKHRDRSSSAESVSRERRSKKKSKRRHKSHRRDTSEEDSESSRERKHRKSRGHRRKSRLNVSRISSSDSSSSRSSDEDDKKSRRRNPPFPKLPTFDGKSGEWSGFIFQFRKLARAGHWTEREKHDRLVGCLRGKAITYVQGRPKHERADYYALRDILNQRYGVLELPATARRQLQSMRQEESETLDDFADRILGKAAEGYPEVPDDTLQILATENFLRGCKDKSAAYAAAERKPETLYEAMSEVRDAAANLRIFGNRVCCQTGHIQGLL